MSNEIVVEVMPELLTPDGLKLDNVPVIVQPGQAVGHWIGFRLWSQSGFERRNK
jgi:hypothetical protein